MTFPKKQITPFEDFLEENICWTSTREDIIKQIISLNEIWLQQQLTGSDLITGRCWDLTIEKLVERLKNEF